MIQQSLNIYEVLNKTAYYKVSVGCLSWSRWDMDSKYITVEPTSLRLGYFPIFYFFFRSLIIILSPTFTFPWESVNFSEHEHL